MSGPGVIPGAMARHIGRGPYSSGTPVPSTSNSGWPRRTTVPGSAAAVSAVPDSWLITWYDPAYPSVPVSWVVVDRSVRTIAAVDVGTVLLAALAGLSAAACLAAQPPAAATMTAAVIMAMPRLVICRLLAGSADTCGWPPGGRASSSTYPAAA